MPVLRMASTVLTLCDPRNFCQPVSAPPIVSIPELVCPAGNLPSLKTAVDNGADWVYMGLKDETNARNFAGLNFDAASASEGLRYAHAAGAKMLLAINTYPQGQAAPRWQRAIDSAARPAPAGRY